MKFTDYVIEYPKMNNVNNNYLRLDSENRVDSHEIITLFIARFISNSTIFIFHLFHLKKVVFGLLDSRFEEPAVFKEEII